MNAIIKICLSTALALGACSSFAQVVVESVSDSEAKATYITKGESVYVSIKGTSRHMGNNHGTPDATLYLSVNGQLVVSKSFVWQDNAAEWTVSKVVQLPASKLNEIYFQAVDTNSKTRSATLTVTRLE